MILQMLRDPSKEKVINYTADWGKARIVCYFLYQAKAGRHQQQNCPKLAPIQTLGDETRSGKQKILMAAVGFEPTPPKRLVP